jgi:carbonic anhydrase
MGPIVFPRIAVDGLECIRALMRPSVEELPMRLPLVTALILGMAALAAGQTHAQTTAPWSYEGKTGPALWGRLDPAYQACSRGHEQSPLDMRHARLNKGLTRIEFHYIAGPVTLKNNGHTIVAQVDPGSYMVANGVRYDLIDYHFHHPSETTVGGKLTDMEVHLVHRSADGKLAVVAVRMSEDMSKPNAVLATLWEHLPAKAGATTKVSDMVDTAGLLPADRGYWTYMGSLTTPPCTEGVRWFVMEQDMTVSRSQLNAFAAIFKMNTRPLQELHGRRIEADE